MEQTQETVVISAEKDFSGNKKRNFYLTTFFLGFLGMLFHFTMVFFFTFQLKSVAMVGVFLGIGNLVSFLVDIPVGILQKYFRPKTLFLMGACMQLVTMGIFVLFIFKVANFIGDQTSSLTDIEFFNQLFSFFFGSLVNLALLLVAALFYGLVKEINDVTSLSYIMNNVPPANYSEVMARTNISSGVGMLFGLLLSGVIMAFSPKLIIFSLILIIGLVIYFTTKFFDNADETVNFSDITHLSVSLQKKSLTNIKEYALEKVSKQDLKNLMDKTKYIFLKPKQLKSSLNISDLIEETKNTMTTTFKILLQQPANITIYWTVIVVLTMGFWDTFASTFLINFLDKVKPGLSYVLLGLIALPAFGLQETFGNLGRKVGVLPVAMIGLLLSGSSLFLMGLMSNAGAIIILTLALLNSVGYAASMSLGQINFLDVYNKEYAKYMDLKEIDANASAGPMKILQNLANVFGLMCGGLILGILNYSGFFIVFGFSIIGIFIWSISSKSKINL